MKEKSKVIMVVIFFLVAFLS